MTRATCLRLLSCLVSAVSLSCGGKENTGPAAVATVTVTSPANSVDESDSLQLTATPKDAQGNPLSGRVITWSTNAGAKASVSATGLLHAYQDGNVTVTATCEGVVGNAAIKITVPVAIVTLSPNPATVNAGDTLRLTPSLYGPFGDAPTDSTLAWTSSDTSQATVVAGLVTGKKGGSVTVKATAHSGKSGAAAITINGAVATVTISPHDSSVYVTNRASYVTIVRDARGDTLTQWQESCPSGCKVTYPVLVRSLDTGVAAFIGCCTMTTKRSGVDSVVATSQGVSDTAVLHVKALSFSSVVVGNATACGINADSVAYCWGGAHPSAASGTVRLADIDAGDGTVCGLTSAGLTTCFQNTSDTPAGAPASDSIAVGGTFLCGLTSAGAAWCAGTGSVGQLGSGQDTSYSKAALTVTGGHAFTAIAAGVDNACGIVTGGVAYCWGSNGGGMLGSGDTISHSASPVAVAGGLTFVQISAGFGHSCGVTSTGAGYCWGYNQHGQLGTGDTASSQNTPQLVAGGLHLVAISAGTQHSCGLTDAGTAYCWGSAGLLGTASGAGSNTPVAVDGGLTFATLDAGIAYDPSHEVTCGRTTTGAIYCWGNAVLGVDNVGQSLVPIKVDDQ